LSALPSVLTGRFAIVFARTFLWPGTFSASGAPAAVAVALVLVLALLALLSNLSGNPGSSRRAAAWRAGGLAAGFFLLGQCAQAATYAAIGRARGQSPSAGPDGWYLLVVLPVILSAGCALGRRPGGNAFVFAAMMFLAADWWMMFGVLPGVYDGAIAFNGSNAPISSYAKYLLHPAESLAVSARVGLAGLPRAAHTLAVGLWLLLLASGVFTARGRRRYNPREFAMS